MARKLEEIKKSIEADLQNKLQLSTSDVAEWRLWVMVAANCIYVFELIHDQFKKEVEDKIATTRPGTLQWYRDMAYAFQYNHQLVYNQDTGILYYPVDDEEARIVSVAAVNDRNGTIVFQLAKNNNDMLVPLNALEKDSFDNYINEVKLAGSKVSVISTNGDSVKYNVTVYYDPTYPKDLVKTSTDDCLKKFQKSHTFGSIFYSAQFIDSILHADGVVTVKVNELSCKKATDEQYVPVDVSLQLQAGYFNYAMDCEITYEPTRKLAIN